MVNNSRVGLSLVDSPWWEKPLSELNQAQWEALCDGCGRCCLHKLIDDETDELHYTRVACLLLDVNTGHCSDYRLRKSKVPECVVLTVEEAQQFDWLPNTCAYRLRAHNLPLPSWHPLISGDAESVKRIGVSVAGRVISAKDCEPEDFQEEIIRWVEASPLETSPLETSPLEETVFFEAER